MLRRNFLSFFLVVVLIPIFHVLHVSSSFAGQVTLSWSPPTENIDGTPLTDLAGYRLYSGASSGAYDTSVTLGNVTTHTLDLSPGTHYVAVTAYDASGNESTFSNEVSITIQSTGPSPDITVTDSAGPLGDLLVPFGDITEFLTSEQTVTVANDGNAALSIQGIASADSLSGPFSIVADGCSGQSISPGGSCTVIVGFSPTATGNFQDSFDISSDDPDEGLVTVGVSGTGLSSSVNNNPSMPVLVSPAQGEQGLGDTVTFTWKKSSDPDGDGVTYDLYVDENPGFTSSVPLFVAFLDRDDPSSGNHAGHMAGTLLAGLVIAGGVMGRRKFIALLAAVALTGMLIVSCDSGGIGVLRSGSPPPADDDVVRVVSGLNAKTTYYWKVVADDGKGGTSESEVRSFTTQ